MVGIISSPVFTKCYPPFTVSTLPFCTFIATHSTAHIDHRRAAFSEKSLKIKTIRRTCQRISTGCRHLPVVVVESWIGINYQRNGKQTADQVEDRVLKFCCEIKSNSYPRLLIPFGSNAHARRSGVCQRLKLSPSLTSSRSSGTPAVGHGCCRSTCKALQSRSWRYLGSGWRLNYISPRTQSGSTVPGQGGNGSKTQKEPPWIRVYYNNLQNKLVTKQAQSPSTQKFFAQHGRQYLRGLKTKAQFPGQSSRGKAV